MPKSFAFLLCLISASAWASNEVQPEAYTGLSELKHGHGETHMVVAANPWATQAGFEMLELGGSAVDAAIAVQLVLTLVEPQSSGIGGGGFMLVADAGRDSIIVLDGRETAPAASQPTHFQLDSGEPMPFFEALVGGRSVGVPGAVALMAEAHRRYGTLSWEQLFEPAIRLAEQGFPVSPRLNSLLENTPALAVNEQIKGYFFDNEGRAHPVGYILKNPEYASVLRLIAERGEAGFYEGEVANNIVRAVTSDPNSAGVMTTSDLRDYRPMIREAVCLDVWEHEVCGAPPPSSGGITLLQQLSLIERQQNTYEGPLDVNFADDFSRASNLAFADRNALIADPDFFEVPVDDLLDDDYLNQRAAQFDQAMPVAEPGIKLADVINGISPEQPSTTHFSIVDSAGMAVSMTSSIEMGFGSRVMVHGFLLNNQLTDFDFVPVNSDGRVVANSVAPGKRPRSSMSPTMVFDEEGRLALLAGSPGGSRIINYTAQSIANVLLFGMTPAEAVAVPHIVSRNNGRIEVENSQGDTTLAEQLRRRGLSVVEGEQTSGLHLIMVTQDGLFGGADPRREGTVLGDSSD